MRPSGEVSPERATPPSGAGTNPGRPPADAVDAVDAADLYYELIGESFDEWMSDYDVDRRAAMIRRHLLSRPVGGAALEVGCGTGRITERIMDLVGPLTVTDISDKLAREVGKRLGVSAIRQDACNLDLPTGAYDAVISSECIEHTRSPRKALAEMARVLRPGGLLVVTSPNRLWGPVIRFATLTRVRKFAGRERFLFPWSASRTLHDAGITEISLDGCHLYPWQLPLIRRALPFFDRFGEVLYPAMINYCVSGVKAREP